MPAQFSPRKLDTDFDLCSMFSRKLKHYFVKLVNVRNGEAEAGQKTAHPFFNFFFSLVCLKSALETLQKRKKAALPMLLLLLCFIMEILFF